MQNYRMINVGEKAVTCRRAIATGSIRVCEKTFEMIKKGDSPKGNILSIAEVAGIMAAKNTFQILPLCHPILLDSVKVWYELGDLVVKAHCEVICHAKTGVEMEALVGVNTVLLAIYDLAKAVDPVIEIFDVYLQTKEGGKSGYWTHPRLDIADKKENHQDLILNKKSSTVSESTNSKESLTCSVITMSDRASKNEYQDKSGPIILDWIKNQQHQEKLYLVIPDEKEILYSRIQDCVEKNIQVLFITGGTGIGKRDITPETIKLFEHKELQGFGELQRSYGAQFTKNSWLSRSSAFVVRNTLIVLFPGSPKAVQQGLEATGELISHALRMIQGNNH